MGLGIWKVLKKKIDEEPFLLSHHPLCKRFEKHVVTIKGYKVCMGCLFTYPSAFATLIAINILFLKLKNIKCWTLFWMGVIFFGIAMIRKLFLSDDTLSKKIHIAFRIILGISFGFELAAIQFSYGASRIIIIGIVISVATTYNIANTFKNRKICKTCPQYYKFPNCDGFKKRDS